eukprot:CAMPEP_0185731086 /NCGR_PEP_ID=MMETSP1171-20130828/11861_1 /TAXON_ID=374046 /ORGANISM="Helicotheca tamensis, Strain CCMP826" /LENGTH=278 /DNA_ID=CAMNT_0028400271 /DNA_START=12 /DNA_END=845 /DNA_ORIENTATION=-
MFSHQSPFYDYDDYFSPFSSMTAQKLQHQRRQRALETERRRRAELQWRQRQLYEQEARRKREEELRRQREEEYWRHRMGMEEIEKKKQQRLREMMKMNRRYDNSDDEEDHPNMQSYRTRRNKSQQQRPTIVQGLDGRLYRILPDETDDAEDKSDIHQFNTSHQKNHVASNGGPEDEKLFLNAGHQMQRSVKESQSKGRLSACHEDDEACSTESMIESKNEVGNTVNESGVKRNTSLSRSTVNASPKKVGTKARPLGALLVGVEDASDDEDDDDLKSVW